MPIIDIEFIGNEPTADLAQTVADEVGNIFNSPAGQTWVKFKVLPQNQYAENQQDLSIYPVFVSVLLYNNRKDEEKNKIAQQLSEIIAKASGCPQSSVHIIFLPEGKGRVAFGGKFES